MKKLFLALAFIFCASYLHATEIDGPQWLSTTIINEGTAGGNYSATLVSTTNIYPGHDQILGYTVAPYENTLAKPTVCIAALYDQSTTPITNGSGECLGEAEAQTPNMSETVWYPYPQSVSNQVLVWQGPNTAVTIYYRR